uniref:Peptidase C39 domain-containing protein n=1 Tax=uncultured Thiotrichaceae bacterium TaxID=298394 RepID=A0A6S6S967_9GAMM|nr:MAG: Unknown protein [uncultured Thiotrichaceae bacterium]
MNFFTNPLSQFRNKRVWGYYQAQGVNASECGPTIASMLINTFHKTNTSRKGVRKAYPGPWHYNLKVVKTILGNNDVPCGEIILNKSGKIKPEDIHNLVVSQRFTAFHVDGFHFVIVGYIAGSLRVVDPMNGISEFDAGNFTKRITHPLAIYI